MSSNKNDNHTYKKLPEISQFKKLPEDFNDISLNARLHLNQIYSLFNSKRLENDLKSKERYRNEEGQMTNENQKSKNVKTPFINSEQALIRIKKFQNLQKNEILQHNGFQNYIQTNIVNYEKIKETIKRLDNKIHFSGHKEINNFPNLKNMSQKMLLPKIKIINDETKNETNENIKIKISNVNKNKNINNCKKKLLRSSSCDTCCLYLNRPLSPKSIDDSIKLTNKGGGLIYSNSIWRSKNMNNLVANYNSKNLSDKIQQMKNNRYKIIYNKDFYDYITNK